LSTVRCAGALSARLTGETLLLVVHLLGVDEDDEETVRIISAREAAPKERRRYESGLHA